MKWKNRRASSNVEDRRGSGSGMGGIGTKGMFGGGLGIILILIFALMGGDLGSILSPGITPQDPGGVYQGTPEEQELADFVSVVLADTEDAWTQIFREYNLKPYEKPTLVLFSGSVQSACGTAGSSTGPFYCPGDRKVYIDLSFFQELSQRFGAPGDFAMAYVVAHEVGHHVQTLLGTSQQVQDLRGQLSPTEFNKYLVMLELQADYYAGVWAKYAASQGYLEAGDVEEALNAANAIGDDRLQKNAQGYAVPDSFTHGTSAQRMKWFKLGFQYGDFEHGDTFNTNDL
ncbi:neutral zinc metallopeptidase [Proteiniclasticum sp. BAD-10]|uniref:Neutral zinc metallopeptidase n=1 Tax=Proteiniclasticum sediminis TaxID=2804028 RepID=A0A941HRI0_9CLOT|nr:neutral zinc metallopeptidase [Proteiniclasticum sediminis]MBR0577000.1 neutral zinc metallopeptidase [Proteiniclasticum sediminis]